MADRVVDVLLRCRRIMKIGQTSIDRGIFSDSSDANDFVDAMIREVREALQYMRQRMKMRVLVHHMQQFIVFVL